MGRYTIRRDDLPAVLSWIALDSYGSPVARFRDEDAARAFASEAPATDPGDHLDFVHVVLNDGADDPLTVFGDAATARRFEAGLKAGTLPKGGGGPIVTEEPINVGNAAERLIASERGDVLEGMGHPRMAELIREGAKSPADVKQEIEGFATSTGTPIAEENEVYRLLQRWAEEDTQGGQS